MIANLIDLSDRVKFAFPGKFLQTNRNDRKLAPGFDQVAKPASYLLLFFLRGAFRKNKIKLINRCDG